MNWEMAFGDTAFLGLLITALYFFAFLLSAMVASFGSPLFEYKKSAQINFWWCIAVFMLFMSINKQLDLQTIFINIGKNVFLGLDLYDVRREYQRLFTLVVVVISLLLFVSLFIRLLSVIKKHLLALIGLFLLAIYVDARVVSINRLGQVFDNVWQGIPLERLLEFAGVVCILLNAIFLLTRSKQSKALSSEA